MNDIKLTPFVFRWLLQPKLEWLERLAPDGKPSTVLKAMVEHMIADKGYKADEMAVIISFLAGHVLQCGFDECQENAVGRMELIAACLQEEARHYGVDAHFTVKPIPNFTRGDKDAVGKGMVT